MADNPLVNDDFAVRGYLSLAQIEIVKAKSDAAKDVNERKEVLHLIDGFVSSNGKITPEYSELRKEVEAALNLLSPSFHFPATVKEGLPMLFISSYYAFLILVGVISEADIFSMQKKIMDMVSGKFPTTPKA